MMEAKSDWILSVVVVLFSVFLIVEILLALRNSPSNAPDLIIPLPKIIKKLSTCLDFCRIVFVVEVLTSESLRMATENFDSRHINDCETWLYLQALIYISVPIICSVFFWIKLFAVNIFAFFDNPMQLLGTVALIFFHALMQIYSYRSMVLETDVNALHCVLDPFAHRSFVTILASTASWLCSFILFLMTSNTLAGYAVGAKGIIVSVTYKARMQFIARRFFLSGFSISCSGLILLLIKCFGAESDVGFAYWRLDNVIIYVCFLASDFETEDFFSHFKLSSDKEKETRERKTNQKEILPARPLESSTIELKEQLEGMGKANIAIHWNENDLFMYNKSYEDLLDERSSEEMSSSEHQIKSIPLETLYKVPKFRRIRKRIPMRVQEALSSQSSQDHPTTNHEVVEISLAVVAPEIPGDSRSSEEQKIESPMSISRLHE